jgi:hypothetical protein
LLNEYFLPSGWLAGYSLLDKKKNVEPTQPTGISLINKGLAGSLLDKIEGIQF